MFATFGRTWQLTKMSWGVLQSDRKLIAFPIMSGVALVILAALLTGVGAGFGTLERLGAAETAGLAEADFVLLGITYFLLAFVIIYFNAALIGAAMVRLAGGTPTLGDGFRLANSRLPQIAGWALISATVGLILQILRNQSRDNFLGQIALSIVGGVWAYLTFFVVPVLVAEETGGRSRRSSARARCSSGPGASRWWRTLGSASLVSWPRWSGWCRPSWLGWLYRWLAWLSAW